MENFKLEKIIIGQKMLDKITDKKGTNWYPLKSFLQNILCKYDRVASFRDSAMIKYMKVIEYDSDVNGTHRPIKTWCMNEAGIKYLLRHMRIANNGKKKLYNSREKGFYEACLYFKVKVPKELEPKYINVPPKLSNYDIWSLLCIQNDLKLNCNDRWKKCSCCGYYYPDKERYFASKNECLLCQGKNFVCQNKVIQFIYDNNGLELLYQLSKNNNDEIVKSLRRMIERGGE